MKKRIGQGKAGDEINLRQQREIRRHWLVLQGTIFSTGKLTQLVMENAGLQILGKQNSMFLGSQLIKQSRKDSMSQDNISRNQVGANPSSPD